MIAKLPIQCAQNALPIASFSMRKTAITSFWPLLFPMPLLSQRKAPREGAELGAERQQCFRCKKWLSVEW
jgi:hypothetical protein